MGWETGYKDFDANTHGKVVKLAVFRHSSTLAVLSAGGRGPRARSNVRASVQQDPFSPVVGGSTDLTVP